jgi:UDP-GlcNAc:undecaprenyl-phosphate GlcNAc-1-phosphate transferase
MNFSLFAYIPAAVLSAAVFYLFKDRTLAFLKDKNICRMNYSGREVITGAGLLLLFPSLFGAAPFLLTGRHNNLPFYVLMMFSLSFCGLLDDLLGDTTSKGLAGHAGRFLKGGLSTGFIKALTGGIVGLLVAWSRYRSLLLFLMDTIYFALCVNMINLLDLRPGRAIKGFLFLLLFIIPAAGLVEIWALLPAVTALLLYLGGEMKEVYMLGDTGANLLGGILGFYGVIALPVHAKIVLLILLASLHLLAEFQSLSKWIEAVPVLRKIDMLWRKDAR